MKTALVEREHLGGICLNWGCIPTKALLRSAEVLELMRHAASFGLAADNPRFDAAAVVKRSRGVAQQLSRGVGFLLKKNKVTVFDGEAKLAGKGKLAVKLTKGGEETLEAKHIILATGARARQLPGLEADGKLVWTYKEAMVPEKMPKSLLVVGSGRDRHRVRELLPLDGRRGDRGRGAAARAAGRGRGDLGLRAEGVREARHQDPHRRHGQGAEEGRGQRHRHDRERRQEPRRSRSSA